MSKAFSLAALVVFSVLRAASSADLPVDANREAILTEMRARRIIPAAAYSWSGDDEAMLDRIRRAEASGAVDFLREQYEASRKYAVWHREGAVSALWLTKAGYERYLVLRSQQARKYFEDEGTDAKFIFQLKTKEGEDIFNAKGRLTPAGEELYDQILKGTTVNWLDASGQAVNNAPFRPVNSNKE